MIRWIAIGFTALAITLALGIWIWLARLATATDDPAFFEDEIRAFERADQIAPPAPGGIVFVGSSSIRMWSSLMQDMAPLRVMNRGFGGAQLSHVIHNVDRIVTRYTPSTVVVYAGDNDLASGTGKTAEIVLEDWQRLVERVHAKVPNARLYFLAIKPSSRRWPRWPEMKRANAMIEAWNAKNDLLDYIDVASPLLGEDGRPLDALYLLDGLHLSGDGYVLWTNAIRPRLMGDQGR